MTVESEEVPGPALITEEAAADTLVLPVVSEAKTDESLGAMGRPFDRRTPFFIGLTGGLGLAVAYVIARGIGDITSVLIIIGLALFIAIGLNPIVAFLVHRGLSRGLAVLAVTLGFVLAIAGFILLAVPPISHEVESLVNDYPRYKADLVAGRGWAGSLVAKLHLTGYLTGKSKLDLSDVEGGVLGAGKVILSLGVATISVVVLTIYFLIALPGVKRLWLSILPLSRRERVGLLTNEVFDRVGGFMLGNLITSVVSGVGTYIWLIALRGPLRGIAFSIGGPTGPHPYGRLDDRRGRGHAGGAYERNSHRHCHRGLLYCVPLRRGLLIEPKSYEAHGQSQPGPDHYRHSDRWQPAGPRRRSRGHPHCRHHPPADRRGGHPPPKPTVGRAR